MNRRSLLGAALAGFLAPRRGAGAQPTAAPRRIGSLANSAQPSMAEIRSSYAPLGRLGWAEGRNLVVERRYTNGQAELLAAMAQELVRLNVELIVTSGTDATLAAKNATGTIPIVMRSVGDPVRTGLVASMPRPGGNITGYSIVGPELDVKRLSVLRELLPGIQRVAWLESVRNPYYRAVRPMLAEQCRILGLEPTFVEVLDGSRLDEAIAKVARERGQGLVVGSDGLFHDNRVQIARSALERMLPTMVERKAFVRAGALISYSDTVEEMNERLAASVDRILRGAMPRDLPIEQPTRFELAVNLRTAKALGITVPKALLFRADHVIQG